MLPKTPISLEPIYRDAQGELIPKLEDIHTAANHVFERPYNPATKLRKDLRRMAEDHEGGLMNGLVTLQRLRANLPLKSKDETEEGKAADGPNDLASKSFTSEDLMKMRAEMHDKLSRALGQTGLAMNLIEHLLIPVDPNYVLGEEKIPPGALTTTKTVPYSESLRASLPSVRALNSQIIMGTKDMALRNACTIFESAASRTAQTATTSARYWETAVQLRRKNWPLVTAPFHQQGDGVAGRAVNPSDPLAKDFRVAYSMEYSSARFKREALASVKDRTHASVHDAEYLFELKGPSKRLRVGLNTTAHDGIVYSGITKIPKRGKTSAGLSGEDALDRELSWAQAASVEDELYQEVLKEVANLPSASARISDKMLSIDAAVDIVLTLELVDADDDETDPPDTSHSFDPRNSAVAQLIQDTLTILLIRSHRVTHQLQSHRTDPTGRLAFHGSHLTAPPQSPPILAPIVSLLQYDSLVTRIRRTWGNLSTQLNGVGIPCETELQPVGDDIREVLLQGALISGSDLMGSPAHILADTQPTLESSIAGLTSDREELLRVGGEASLRIGGRQIIRLTFVSPAVLTLHLPHATIDIYDMGEFHEFLVSQVSRAVLERLKEIGTRMEADGAGDTASNRTRWLVDGLEGTLVGDGVGGRIQMKVMFNEEFTISAVAIKNTAKGLERRLADPTIHRYPLKGLDGLTERMTLEQWLKGIL